MNIRHKALCITAAALLAAAVGTAQGTAATSQDINPPVLEVNGELVYAADISAVMRNISGQLRALGREVPPDQELVQMATQRVIEQKLLAQEARRRGHRPNDLRIAELAKASEQQAGGREELEAALAASGSSRERLLATITEMDLARTLIEKDVTPSITVGDQEIAEFYAANPEMFQAPERVRARQIFFAAGVDADQQAVDAARARAEAARQRAVAGEDFAALARELSEGPEAERGGDLGVIDREHTVPPVADAVFALAPGGVSEVVRSHLGLHVLKVEQKLPAESQTLEEATPRVRTLIAQGKVGGQVQELLRSLGQAADIRPVAPPTAAAASAGAQEPPR